MHATIILLPSIVLAYDMLCPDHSQRLLRSQGLCINKKNTKSVYTCLEDVNKEAFVESCSEEEDAVRPGRRYVVKGRTTGDECDTHRYQPMKFQKTSGAMCTYLKSTCTEVGQMVARNGSGIADTTCTCRYTEGYAYLTKPRDACNCVPSEEDCTCYKKQCPENHLLSAENECIHRNVTRMTKFATVNKSWRDVTTTISIDTKALSPSEIRVKYVAICVTVLTVICVLMSVIIWYRDIEYFTENLPKLLECIEGENVELSCAVLEANIPAYWSKDGIICQPSYKYKINNIGKNHMLSIQQLDLQDAGNYCVMINNQKRSSSIHVKEYFTKAFGTQACIEGENIQFECEVLDDNQTALWFKNGIKVSTSDKYKVEGHGKLHRLGVNSTKLDDKGEYSVRIKNCVRLSKLIVQEYFTKAFDTQTCIVGENVKFECEVLDDNPTALWFKDGTRISTSDKYKVERHGKIHRLVVKDTKLDDKGEYSVSIKNCVRQSKLVVQEIPAAIRQLGEEDKGLYLELIKSATETRYYIRIVIIGENGVGKTCLMRRLHGESIDNVESTDGVDVVHRCKIRLHDGQWVIGKDTNKRNNIMTRINRTINSKTSKTSEDHQNQPGLSREVIQTKLKINSVEDKIEVNKLSATSTGGKDNMVTEQSTQSKGDKDKIDVTEPSTSNTDDKVKMEVTEPSTSSKDDKDKKEVTEPSTPFKNDKDKMEVTEPSTPRKDDKDKMEVTEPSTPRKDDKDKMEVTEPSTRRKDYKDKMDVIELSTPRKDYKDKMEVTEPSTANKEDKDKMEVTEPLKSNKDDIRKENSEELFIPENQFGNSVSMSNKSQTTENKIVTRLEKILTEAVLNELSHLVNDIEKYDIPNEVMVDCGFWDFAGQRQYYPTHQIFLNPNAVHLLVADIMKDIKQINTEVGYDKIGEYIDFWFDSIHSCRDFEDTKDSTGEFLHPSVIVVCTGIDKCKDKLDDRKNEFRKQLQKILHSEDKQKHLRRICYISNTEPSDTDLDRLRQSIFEFGKNTETFGERLPLRWIRLEQALDILCESGVNILSFPDMADLASKFSIQGEKEVRLFLKYHHKIGSIIYFESLREHIILNQKWLADAFRCFISDKYDDDLKLTEEWKTLEKTGELKPCLIAKLFRKEPKREFYKHKDHLLQVMEMFGIIVKLKDIEEQSVLTYYMPCMICEKNTINQIYDVFGVNRDICTQTPWLVIQFDFMPFDFFNHIFCHYIRKYSVCTETLTGRVALYHGIGVFFLDNTKTRKFILCFSKNTIAMQIWQWRKLDRGKCKSMLEELGSVIHYVKDKFEPRKVSYTVKIKYAKDEIHIPTGQYSYKESIDFDSNEYFCEQHNEMHDTRDFFQTWFEEYTENSTELFAEKTEPAQAAYQTSRTLSITYDRRNSNLLFEKVSKIQDYGRYTPLMEACVKGHLSAVQRLIEKGADYNASDSTVRTVFSWSCVGGNIDIIDFLVTKGCDIDKPDNRGVTPLMEACRARHLSAVQRLIEKGANYNASDSLGCTVFFWSCVGGNVDIVEFLIKKCDIHQPDNNGKTPLMAACGKGHLSAVQRLIEKGVDYNDSDSTGCTVFYWSCVGGNIDIIDFLITKGCDINKPNNSEKTPLMEACAKGHLSVVQRLIEKGADYNAIDSTGRTVFSWSCGGVNVDIINILITKCCDIHKSDNSGVTPLMVACANRHPLSVKRLIEKGADYMANDSTGRTVFFWSCTYGNDVIIDFLASKGCDIHKPDNSGVTPLMEACAKGHLSAVQRLIEKGADYNAIDSKGRTVFFMSCASGNVQIMDILTAKGYV